MHSILYRLWALFQSEKLGASNYIPVPQWFRDTYGKIKSKRTQVIMYARMLLGSKVYKGVPYEVACANCVTGILELVDPSFFGSPTQENRINGTASLHAALANSPRFTRSDRPLPCCIVLNPTGNGYPGTRGHVGFVDLDGKSIMSNDSATGKWKRNYTTDTWNAYFHITKGIPTEYWIINY